MRKILLFAAALLSVTAVNAKVWRINYEDNAKADFKTIKEACNEEKVQDGDTLYMEPGYHNGNNADNTITRPLTVLGPGYSIERNTGSTSPISTAEITSIDGLFIDASDVFVAGIVARNINISQGYTSNEKNNITIERCHVTSIRATQCTNHVVVRNNYVNSYISMGNNSCNYNSVIGNLVFGYVSLPSSNNSLHNLCQYNTIISHDASKCVSGGNATIKDNILINTKYTEPYYVFTWDETCEFHHNVLSVPSASANAKFPDNYYVGATVDNTFVNATEGVWYDEAMKYQLLETSAAKKAAHAGDDCGAFGGAHPYVLFGRPQGVPYIYDVEVPAQPEDNKLHVTFKVSGQNE